jgi:hypothetical protein
VNRIGFVLFALTGCLTPGDGLVQCVPTLDCAGGTQLESCANGAGECWYQIGDDRFDCEGTCSCEAAAAEASAVCLASS